jgi:exopolysaccharide production protein ExoZ
MLGSKAGNPGLVTNPPIPMHLGSLHVLRGVASLLVLLFHATWYGGEPRFLGGAFLAGGRGVDLFFLLSGFVMTWTYRSSSGNWRELPRFLLARATRIYFPYWVVAAVTAIYCIRHSIILPAWSESLRVILLAGTGTWVIPPSYTLPMELLCYLVFSLVFLLGWTAWLAVALLWLSANLVVLAKSGSIDGLVWSSPFAIEFLVGVLVAKLTLTYQPRVSRAYVWAAMIAFSLVFLNESRSVANQVYRHAPFACAATALLLILVWHELSQRPHYPAPLKLLGDASYSIFLSHYFLIWETNGIAYQLNVKGDFVRIVGASVVLAVGLLVWWAIERPLLNLRGVLLARVTPTRHVARGGDR